MIDLHVHSTASDGTNTPEWLAERGKDYAVMALTDHDNVDGVRRFLDESARIGARGIRLAGLELSIEPGEGYNKFHLLCLGIDPENEGLLDFLDRIREGRNERNREICAKLAAMGYAFPMEELRKYANGKIVARPHIARVMMDHGWAESVHDAFTRFLGDGAPAYVPRYRPSQQEAIDVVHAASGAAVMAHPRYWTNDATMLRTGLARLKEMGLDGIEAVYEANCPGETVEHLRTARELDLPVTAGSDFHGANKPNISLGMKVDDEDAFIAPFLARLAARRAECAAKNAPSHETGREVTQ